MALKIVEKLLNDFNSCDINYCHWKSNEHLDAAINGDTDLDILFEVSQKKNVIEILERNNFHLFEAVWYRKYSGIVDYIGFDKEKGKIVHVHTHFKLDIGEVGIKSYHLPWESLILHHKHFDPNFNIYKSSPEIEYLLLIVRTAFKHDLTDTKINQKIAKHFELEAKWLYNQVDFEKLKSISLEILDDKITFLVEEIRFKERYDEKLFVSLKKLLQPFFSKDRILSPTRVVFLKVVHLVKRLQVKCLRLLKFPIRVSKRSLPHEGIIVCLMGSDGAGKSTQTKEITQELSKKVDTLFMYMGSGNGSKSLQREIIDTIISFGIKKRKSSNKLKSNTDKETSSTDISKKGLFRQFVISLRAVSLAYEKKNRLNRIYKEKKSGKIIICDRYPQTSILGYNDSPRLYSNIKSTNIILRAMAKYEFSCYEKSKEIYPDLVIKLIGSIEVLHKRRPEMTIDEINKKQNGIINLPFDFPTEVLTIDIDRPIHEIKGDILYALSQKIK